MKFLQIFTVLTLVTYHVVIRG